MTDPFDRRHFSPRTAGEQILATLAQRAALRAWTAPWQVQWVLVRAQPPAPELDGCSLEAVPDHVEDEPTWPTSVTPS